MSDDARRELPRCKVTGNPCGTDTWAVGHPCQCESCVAYQRGRDYTRLEPPISKEEQK